MPTKISNGTIITPTGTEYVPLGNGSSKVIATALNIGNLGVGNSFTKFTGPTTSTKTFTLPDANATLLYNGGPLGAASATSVTITGTGGNGFVELLAQSSNPAAPASGTRIFSNSNSKLSWRGSANNFVKTFDGSAATSDRVYSLPDFTGNVLVDAGTNTLSGATVLSGTSTNTLKFLFNSLGTTQTDGAGVYLQNSSAAAAGAQQTSPALTLEGQGWATTPVASQTVKVIQDVLPVQGTANPAITWRLRQSINGVAYADMLTIGTSGTMTLTSGGNTISFAGTTINASSGTLNLQTGGSTRISVTNTGTTFTQSNLSAAWTSSIISTPGAHTALTTATEFISRDFQGATQTWIDGTVATQRFNHFKAYTANKTTTSATFTDIYNGFFEKSIAGSGVTFTRNWGIGTNGNLQIQGSAYIGAATTAPTALLHLAAGTTSASSAPIKLTSGTSMTSAEAGAVEFTTDDLFFTITTGTARKNITLWDTLGTSGRVPFNTTNGRLTDNSGFTWASATGITSRISPRVVSMTDATSFTPTGDTADINTQANTQATGTLTANAPSGTPVNGQVLEIVLKSTNVQTFSWNGIYAGCTTTALPTTSTGAGKTDKFFFQYNSDVSKWQIYNAEFGYT